MEEENDIPRTLHYVDDIVEKVGKSWMHGTKIVISGGHVPAIAWRAKMMKMILNRVLRRFQISDLGCLPMILLTISGAQACKGSFFWILVNSRLRYRNKIFLCGCLYKIELSVSRVFVSLTTFKIRNGFRKR